MAYSTGTATGPSNLLSSITSFLTTNGWTEEAHRPDENATGWDTYYFSKSGNYFFLRTDNLDDLYLGVLTGYSAGATLYSDQPGYLYQCRVNAMTGAYTSYHLFSGTEDTGEYFYCAVEGGAGVYTHFGMGWARKIGVYTGGEFAVGLFWNLGTSYWRNVFSDRHARPFDSTSTRNAPNRSMIRADINATPEYYLFGLNTDQGAIVAFGDSQGGLAAAPLTDSPNTFNGRSVLFQNHLRIYDNVSWYQIVGVAPGFRSLQMDNLDPQDIVDTDWMVFPIKAKNAPSGPSSGNWAYAYKQ